jgi:hypothetical protein
MSRPVPDAAPSTLDVAAGLAILALLVILAALALPGTAAGQLATSPAQFWLQTSAGIDLPDQDDAYFGSALAAGDFNGDGFDELAIGIPEYDLTDLFDVGLVLVMPGSWEGPLASGIDLWTQNGSALVDEGEEDDGFGRTLAVGDFNNDGYDDLAVGVPNEGIDLVAHAGAVQILYGSVGGLSTAGDQFLHQGAVDGGEIIGAPEENDRFGTTLAVGDFNADGYDDLAVGVPHESVGTTANAGAFHVLRGSAAGITPVGDRIFYLGNDMPGTPTSGDFLGWSLAAGDFDPDSPGDELAVGAPGTWVSGLIYAGAVWIVSDLAGTASSDQLDLDTAAMPGDAHAQDQFGCALAAGDFDGVGGDDLAITACSRQVGMATDAGAIYVSYFGARPAIELDQNGLPQEQAETGDYFGLFLSAGDFDADGVDDLVAGVAFEDVGGDESVGVTHILRGVFDSGVTKFGATTLRQTMSLEEPEDRFGQMVVAGRFSGHSGTDLAIAAPSETYAGNDHAGAVHVLFSKALLVDGFEGANTASWSFVEAGF